MRLPLQSYQALLLQYLRPQWRRMLLLFLLLLTSVGLQLVNPQILRYFIDTALASSTTAPLLLAGLLFIGIALLNQGASVWATYVSENLAWTATNTLRTDLIAHCLRMEMAFHKAHTPGELIERIDGDVDTLSNFFSQLTVHLLANTLLLVGVLALLFQIDWRVGLPISAFALLALLVLLRIRGLAVSLWVKDRQMDAEFFSFIGEQLVGTEDIRANGATLYVMRRFYLFLRRWLPIRRRAGLAGYAMGMTTMTLFALGNALSFALGAYLWSQHATSIGTIYLIFYYTNLLTQPLEQIRMQLQDLQRAGAGIERVNSLLHTEATIQDGIGTSIPAGALSVAFEDVTFSYTGDEAVLHGLSFSLQAGHVLGVLGHTGSGKTTLARLLLRLYDTQAGTIRVGDVPVQEARLHDLRRHIGMVAQKYRYVQACTHAQESVSHPLAGLFPADAQ